MAASSTNKSTRAMPVWHNTPMAVKYNKSIIPKCKLELFTTKQYSKCQCNTCSCTDVETVKF
jgi:hypothetical protein